MTRTVIQYQKAYKSITEKLKLKDDIIAIMVFGSIVSGDLWDESDIDLFVITNIKSHTIKNIYMEEKGVPVHMKLMGKSKFLNLHEKDLKGGFIHRIFASSKLVFSKDIDITSKFDHGRYYQDIDRELWNLVYLGNVLKDIGMCKKYLSNNSVYAAYVAMVKCLEEYSKLYINASGYMISKDAISMIINLDDGIKEYIDKFFFSKDGAVEAIEECIEYMQKYIDGNIKRLSTLLIEYMKKRDEFLSSQDIKRDELFVDFDIDMEGILTKLWKKNLVKKEYRDYKSGEKNILFKENVYYL